MKKRSTTISRITKAITAFTFATTLFLNGLSTAIAADETNAQEYVDTANTSYFWDASDRIWEFNVIYEFPKNMEITPQLLEYTPGTGVVCRLYDGEETPWYVQPFNKSPYSSDNEGTFEYGGDVYSYSIVPSNLITSEDKAILFSDILGYEMSEYERALDIMYCDFHKDGKIDIADIVLLNKYYASTPTNFCTKVDKQTMTKVVIDYIDFFQYLEYEYWMGEKEITIRYGDKAPSDSLPETARTTPAINNTNLSAPELVAVANQLDINQVGLVVG